MGSRKTYFGIGWPKGGPDPDSGTGPRSDPEDRSAPTVVDDEKVAEGLRQLRSWYQGDAPDANPPGGSPPAPAGSGARPTAVGHATAPPAAVAQRPIAPDPMRATMYGHDVHKFDLDTTPPAGGAAPPPAQSSTALVIADPGRQQEIYRPQPEAVPRAVGRSGSDPFPLARFGHGEAERLQRPARASGAYQPLVRPVSRAQVASRIMFGVGLVALIAAAIFWYQAGGSQEAPAAPMPAVSQPASPAAPHAASNPQPSRPVPTTPAPVAPTPERTATPTPSPERTAATAGPAPIPAAPVTLPKTVRLRLPGQPDPEYPVRRRQPPKPVVVEPTETDEAATPIAPPVADKPTREIAEPKEVKAHAGDAEPREAKEIKEAKESQEPKEPRPRKEPKVRSTDIDATLPPSLE